MNTTGIQWPSIAMQGIILGNISIIWSQGKDLINSYFLFSTILIISLFIQQVISRRMFFLFPGREDLGPTPMIDTYILRAFIALAAVSFSFGLGFNSIQDKVLMYIEKLLDSLFFTISIIFFLVWPLIFGLFLKGKIRNKINKRKRDKKGGIK